MFEKRPHLIPCIIAALILLGALAPWPYAYYQLLRFVTCGVAVYVAFTAYKWQKMWAVWMFGFVVLLFNPLIPIHLSRELWQPIDVICAILFVVMAFVLKKTEEQKQHSAGSHDISMEMTILEAEQILDIVSAAFQEETEPSRLYPISVLKGYDVFQIDIALKLRIARVFLVLAKKSNFDEKFSEVINTCGSIPLNIVQLFVPDGELEKLSKLPLGSPEFRKQRMEITPEVFDVQTKTFKDKHLASMETASSFGDYCKYIGSEDPLYWQKIYTRIGLKHTSTSPRGNQPVFLD